MKSLISFLCVLTLLPHLVLSQNVGIGIAQPASKFDVMHGSRSGTHPSGLPLYVTGDIDAASNGIEFRHSNASQGLGFGFNTIYAAGTNTDQDINMISKGDGNIGIGTASPAADIEMRGNAVKIANKNDKAHTWLPHTSGQIYLTSDLDGSGNGDFYFRTYSTGASYQNLAVLEGNTGHFGIGTTDPGHFLHVVGSAFVDQGKAEYSFNNDNLSLRYTQDNTHFPYIEWRDDAGTRGMFMGWGAPGNYIEMKLENNHDLAIDGGNVGIGTTDPGFQLDVNGTAHARKFVVQDETDGGPNRGIFMWRESDPNWGIYMGQSGAGKSLDGDAATAGNGFSAHAIRFRVNNSSNQGFIFENDEEDNLFSIRGSDGHAYFSGNLRLGNLSGSGSRIATLDNDGDIGATDSPSFENIKIRGIKLAAFFRNPVTGGGTISWDGSNFSWTDRIIAIPAGDDGSEHMNSSHHTTCGNQNPGTLSIGVSSWNIVYMRATDSDLSTNGASCNPLQVSAYGSYDPSENDVIVAVRNGDNGMLYTAWGVILAPGESYSRSKIKYDRDLEITGKFKSAGINETSDKRFKKEIQTLDNSLEKIKQLRGVSYYWKKDEFPDRKFDTDKEIGVIAQEVEKVLPELVDTDEEGYKSVQYSHLVSVLIEAVKEQQIEIDHLKDQNCSLSAELKDYKAVMDDDVKPYLEILKRIDLEKLENEFGNGSEYAAQK